MAENLKGYGLSFDSTYVAGTETDFIVTTAGSTVLTESIVANSTSATANILTVKVYYNGAVVFSIDYTIAAGSSMFLPEISNVALDGNNTTPDKITLTLASAPATGEVIYVLASAVAFS